MRLARLEPATEFKIKSPIWNGNAKQRMVGLALNRITTHNVIEFTYTRKDGTRSIPGKFYFDGRKLQEVDYQRQNIKGLTLVLIPISDLDSYEGRTE